MVFEKFENKSHIPTQVCKYRKKIQKEKCNCHHTPSHKIMHTITHTHQQKFLINPNFGIKSWSLLGLQKVGCYSMGHARFPLVAPMPLIFVPVASS
jgi:hypothetical protein